MSTKTTRSLALLTDEYSRTQSMDAMRMFEKDPQAYLENFPQILHRMAPSKLETLVKNNVNDKTLNISFHNRLVQAHQKTSPAADVKGKAAKKAAKRSLHRKTT